MSSPTWLDPIITKPDVFHSLQYMRGDDTDDTAGFQAMLAAVRMNGGGHIVMQRPPKRYRFEATGNGFPGANFPSNTEMYGEVGTEVYWTGAPKKGDFGGKAGSYRFGWLDIGHGSSTILIRDLIIRSDNTPFVSYFNNESTSIHLEVTPRPPHDITIRDCVFLNHVGSPIQAPGGGVRIHTIRNTYQDCADGENVNADYSVHFRCRYINTESLEASGAYNVFALNDFAKSFTTGAVMSVGGDTSRGARRPGSLVIGNTISGTPGLGIITAEAFVEGWLQGNVVEGAANSAIQIGGATPGLYDHNAIVQNICSSSRFGINIFNTLATDTLVAENVCSDDFYAFLCTGARATVIRNAFSGRGMDVSFHTADSTLFLDNTYHTNRLEVLGSAAFLRSVLPTGAEASFFGSIEQGMVTVHVKNWSADPIVRLDLGGILAVGDRFALHHPYDLLGVPVLEGTYSGFPLRLTMEAIVAPPDWSVSTSHSMPRLERTFAGFVLRPVRAR
jgi:hypothetical protein